MRSNYFFDCVHQQPVFNNAVLEAAIACTATSVALIGYVAQKRVVMSIAKMKAGSFQGLLWV